MYVVLQNVEAMHLFFRIVDKNAPLYIIHLYDLVVVSED